jgi:hypothetical protein
MIIFEGSIKLIRAANPAFTFFAKLTGRFEGIVVVVAVAVAVVAVVLEELVDICLFSVAVNNVLASLDDDAVAVASVSDDNFVGNLSSLLSFDITAEVVIAG